MKRSFYLLLFLLTFTCFAYGKVELPSVLADNMVLQQKSKVNLWGKATPAAMLEVTTSWDTKKYTTKVSANGSWKLQIATPAAGGPYAISFNDGEKTELSNVLIGEVWVCSGQSNMEMPMEGFKNQPVLNSETIIAQSDNSNLRLFTVKRDLSYEPKDDCEGNWTAASPASVEKFSAVAYQYGQMLQKKLGVPVGIIASSWGGTPIKAWMGESVKAFEKPVSANTKIAASFPSVLFNAMINPITPYTIKGFLWYQGESDRKGADTYAQKMEAMVKEWRTKWGQGKLPFYYVQIAPWLYPNESPGIAAYLREAQLKASHLIPNSAMVVTIDIGSDKTIHPEDKTTVAQRLVNCALNNTYGFKDISSHSADYKSMRVNGNKVFIKFDHANGLMLKNDISDNFEIAGSDKVFYKADVKVSPKGLEVMSSQVNEPVAVRYAFKNYLVGDLFTGDGLPVSPFRTDDW